MKLANTTTYTGRSLDTETGLYYYRNRYYHAQLGRFVGRDPIGYEGSQWNLYEYAYSSPALLRDGFGLGCKIDVRCTLKSQKYTPATLGRDCFYECKETNRTSTNAALGEAEPFTCEKVKANHTTWHTVSHTGHPGHTIPWVGITIGRCPPANCEKSLDTTIWYASNDEDSPHNCDKAECRQKCETGQGLSEFCGEFKNPATELACNTAAAIGGQMCRDFCNLWCNKGN